MTEVKRPSPQLLQGLMMTPAIRTWRNCFQVLQDFGPLHRGCFSLTDCASECVQAPAIICKRPDTPSFRFLPGQRFFRELLYGQAAVFAGLLSFEPLPNFQQQLGCVFL